MTSKTKIILEEILMTEFSNQNTIWKREGAKEVITVAKELDLNFIAESMQRKLINQQ